MKKTLLTIALLFSFNAAANDKEVIAIVDGTKITRGELEKSLAEMAELVDGGKPKLETFPKDFQKEFINKYIDKVLIVKAAKKEGAHKSPEIQEQLREAEDYLAQKKYLSNLVMRERSEKTIKKLYNEKVVKQGGKLEVHASHILVKSKEEAEKLKKKLDDGEDFEKLAKENSTEPGAKVSAGDLGYFTKEQMVPEFSKTAFDLKAGEISEPVNTAFGWHVIKSHDKRKKKPVSYKKAKPALEAEIARRIIADKVLELRKKSEVDIKLDLEPEKKAEEKAEEKPKEKAEPKKEAKKADEEKKAVKVTGKDEKKSSDKKTVKKVTAKEEVKKVEDKETSSGE